MDKYKIDSHKLMYHVSRVNDWINKKLIYPIYMELSPIGACNHRCVFCGLDFMGYKPDKLALDMLVKRMPEFSKLGIKSIMYAGEGEPFLHNNMVDIIQLTKKNKIDVAITTNGVLLKPETTEKVLSYCSWIKVSINGATPETYSKIHRTKSSDFNKVIKNLEFAAKYRKINSLNCTLGMQIILLPEVENELQILAETARNIGMDYLVVKPYSQHPQSITEEYKDINYSKYEYLHDKLQEYNTDTFSVIFRLNTMEKWDKAIKDYDRCLGLPFWSYIDAAGNVWGCSMFLNNDAFLYGNINKNSFKRIWESEKRQKSLKYVENVHCIGECRINCRMDSVNKYLWDLKHPGEHVNFI